MGTGFPMGANKNADSTTLWAPPWAAALAPRGVLGYKFSNGGLKNADSTTLSAPTWATALAYRESMFQVFQWGPKNADSTTLWAPPWAPASAHRGSMGTSFPMGAQKTLTVPHVRPLDGAGHTLLWLFVHVAEGGSGGRGAPPRTPAKALLGHTLL